MQYARRHLVLPLAREAERLEVAVADPRALAALDDLRFLYGARVDPLVVPAELVRRRPDVAAAQARLHVATAQYGAAIANLYPQIRLSAAWGRESYHLADLFSGPSAVWAIAAGLTQPIFRGGALEAAKRAAGRDRETALAAYVGT